jgi:hypothetical protein
MQQLGIELANPPPTVSNRGHLYAPSDSGRHVQSQVDFVLYNVYGNLTIYLEKRKKVDQTCAFEKCVARGGVEPLVSVTIDRNLSDNNIIAMNLIDNVRCEMTVHQELFIPLLQVSAVISSNMRNQLVTNGQFRLFVQRGNEMAATVPFYCGQRGRSERSEQAPQEVIPQQDDLTVFRHELIPSCGYPGMLVQVETFVDGEINPLLVHESWNITVGDLTATMLFIEIQDGSKVVIAIKIPGPPPNDPEPVLVDLQHASVTRYGGEDLYFQYVQKERMSYNKQQYSNMLGIYQDPTNDSKKRPRIDHGSTQMVTLIGGHAQFNEFSNLVINNLGKLVQHEDQVS